MFSSRIKVEKFNGKNVELQKLNMEDLLVDKEKWIIVDPSTQPSRPQPISTQTNGTKYIVAQTTTTQSTSMLKEYQEKVACDRGSKFLSILW